MLALAPILNRWRNEICVYGQRERDLHKVTETGALIDQLLTALSEAGYKLLRREPSEGWRPIETAPKDRTPVLLRLKNPIPWDRTDLRAFDGIAFVGRHNGDLMEWCFAAPVGQGGFPDDWFVGWMPLPEPPSAPSTAPEGEETC